MDFAVIAALTLGSIAWIWWSGTGLALIQESDQAQEFLTTLWQVEATAVALSAAVVTVGFQIYASTRYAEFGGTLRQFALASGLLRAIIIGVVAVAVTGVVLLVVSSADPTEPLPRGSTASVTVAIALSAVALASIPWVFFTALRAGDVNFLQGHRLRRIKRDIDRTGLWYATRQRGEKLLQETMHAHHLTYSTLTETDSQARVKANEEGWIRDVQLDRLAYLGDAWGQRNGEKVEVFVFVGLGERVKNHSELIAVPGAHPLSMMDAVGIFRIGKDPAPSGPAEDLRRTHRQGLTAIRADDDQVYDAVADTYRAASLFEAAVFAREGLDELDPPGSIIHLVGTDLNDQVREAIRADRAKIVLAATAWPSSVGFEVVASQGDFLAAERMILLLLGLATVAIEESGSPLASTAFGSVAEGILFVTDQAADHL